MKRKDREGAGWVVMTVLGAITAGVLALPAYQAYLLLKDSPPNQEDAFQGEFPGLDGASGLTRPQRRDVVMRANSERCPCGCGFRLAACLTTDSACPHRLKNLARIAELIAGARKAADRSMRKSP